MKYFIVFSFLLSAAGFADSKPLPYITYDGVFLTNCSRKTAEIYRIDWSVSDMAGNEVHEGGLKLAPGAGYFLARPYESNFKPSFNIFSNLGPRACFSYRPYRQPESLAYHCGIRGSGYEVRVQPDKKTATVLFNGQKIRHGSFKCSLPEGVENEVLGCASSEIDHGPHARLFQVGESNVFLAEISQTSVADTTLLVTLTCQALSSVR